MGETINLCRDRAHFALIIYIIGEKVAFWIEKGTHAKSQTWDSGQERETYMHVSCSRHSAISTRYLASKGKCAVLKCRGAHPP